MFHTTLSQIKFANLQKIAEIAAAGRGRPRSRDLPRRDAEPGGQGACTEARFQEAGEEGPARYGRPKPVIVFLFPNIGRV